MPIDVYDTIKPLLDFKTEDDFYYLQIIQRRKDNPHIGSNSRIIKNYYISSIDYFDKKYDEIKEVCEHFNARASLRLNKRSYRKVAFATLIKMSNVMSNGDYNAIHAAYSRACGNTHNDKNKKWIIDIDAPYTRDMVTKLVGTIHQIEPVGDKLIIELPTKTGVHLITRPFNLATFKGNPKFEGIDIHKDNPINLYIPGTGESCD